jgi:diphosphate-dependent phosphofructokinase
VSQLAVFPRCQQVREALLPWNRAVLDYLPPLIRDQLFSERESHGTLQLSQISTEALLADLVASELSARKAAKAYTGTFAPITHFFGYQARCSLPSNFDCDYAYCLGRVSALLAQRGHTGYAASVTRLHLPPTEWQVCFPSVVYQL